MRKQKLFLALIFLPSFLTYFVVKINAQNFETHNDPKISNTEKIGITNQLQREGRMLVKQERYDQAEKKFLEADNPKYWLYEGHPNGLARGWLRDLYKYEGKYEAALENLQMELILSPNHQPFLDEKMQYEVLIKYRDEGKVEVIHELIKNLRTKYEKLLPPEGYNLIASLRPISTILRLYDTIGDYDAGIQFIDECLKFFKERKEAQGKKFVPGKNYNAYLKIREAFEQDKAEGTKGRATKALIQSDYFPW